MSRRWSGTPPLVAALVAGLVVPGVVAPNVVAAQDAPADSASGTVVEPRVGERVRLRVRDEAAGGRAVDCDARVAAVVGDTVVLHNTNAWHLCPRRAYAPDGVEFVRVARGGRWSRLTHSALGLGIGAVAGGLLGYALADAQCSGACGDEIVVPLLTTGGVLVGGVVGTVVGALLPAGPNWVTLPRTPLRVAGMSVRPTIRVAVGGR